MQRQFYVYVYRDPDTLEPFYVGKGQNGRCRKHLHQTNNRSMRTRIRKLKDAGKLPVIETIPTADEAEAYEIEASLILAIGRTHEEGGPLVNLLAAGEKTTGFKGRHHTEEAKAAMRAKLKGRPKTEEHRRKLKEAAQRRLVHFSEETRAKARAAQNTPEFRARLSERAKRTVTPERLAEMTERARLATTGRKQTPEQVRKRIEATLRTKERKRNASA